MKFFILDERQVWWRSAIEAAQKHGYEGVRINSGLEVKEPGAVSSARMPILDGSGRTETTSCSCTVT